MSADENWVCEYVVEDSNDAEEMHPLLQNDPDFDSEYLARSTREPEFIAIEEDSDASVENAEQGQSKKWDEKTTKFFVDAYRKRAESFRDPKIKKKTLWAEIRQEMNAAGFQDMDEYNLDRKMRNMKKTYRTIKEKISKKRRRDAGRGYLWPYFDTFDVIFSKGDLGSSSQKPTPRKMISLRKMRRKQLMLEERKVKATEEMHEKLIETNRHLKERNELLRQLITRLSASTSTQASSEAN